mmetsp:Transcript_52943/g.115812  ORF Transcript_52943/g.115812 Transcript_52943/m.115812 type:complete len:171 (-) Transcript_52943:1427-1939(-)
MVLTMMQGHHYENPSSKHSEVHLSLPSPRNDTIKFPSKEGCFSYSSSSYSSFSCHRHCRSNFNKINKQDLGQTSSCKMHVRYRKINRARSTSKFQICSRRHSNSNKIYNKSHRSRNNSSRSNYNISNNSHNNNRSSNNNNNKTTPWRTRRQICPFQKTCWRAEWEFWARQ